MDLIVHCNCRLFVDFGCIDTMPKSALKPSGKIYLHNATDTTSNKEVCKGC